MKISICGDICPNITNDLYIKGETETLYHDVPEAFADSDRVLINLETALTEKETTITKYGPNLKASPLCVNVLKEIGVTDVGISNNHVFDFGVPGMEDTLKFITEAGFQYTGFGKNSEDARRNLIMEKDGISVAVIAVCEHEYCYALEDRMGTRGYDPYDTIEDIRKAKKEHDYVVVTYHGGKEQCVYPSPRLRKACQAMVRNGADVVLCQHSHCIGCYEEYQGGHILYGQGNFHFVPKTSRNAQWQNGLLVQLDLTDKVNIEFVPVKVIVGSGIELAKGADKEEILEFFEAQSANLHNGKWLEGWKDFCEAYRKQYEDAILGADKEPELFAHYLYCEAHRDVWEQLYKLSWETREEI